LLPPHNFPKIWYENKRHISKLSNLNLILNFKQNLIEDFYQQNKCFKQIFNFNNLFQLKFTIFLNFNMISDGNIFRLLYFLSFILSTWSSIPCPSFNHTLANFENKNKWIGWMFSAASQIAEAELFYGALYLYPFLFVFKFCFSHVHNTLSIKFSWWRGEGWGGRFTHFPVFYLE